MMTLGACSGTSDAKEPLYGPRVNAGSGADPGGWNPRPIADLPEHMRPAMDLVTRFMEALHDARIGPPEVWQMITPDHAREQVTIGIFPDDQGFRDCVSRVMPAGSYVIKIERVMPASGADE